MKPKYLDESINFNTAKLLENVISSPAWIAFSEQLNSTWGAFTALQYFNEEGNHMHFRETVKRKTAL